MNSKSKLSIKSKLIAYLKQVAKDTSEVNLRKDIIPVIQRKFIRNIPQDALLVGAFLTLVLSNLTGIVKKDPKLQKLIPLHISLKQIYERNNPKRKYEQDLKRLYKVKDE